MQYMLLIMNSMYSYYTVLKSYLAVSHLLPVECDIAPPASLIKPLPQNQLLISIHYSFVISLKSFSISHWGPKWMFEGGTAESSNWCSERIEFWSRIQMDFHPVLIVFLPISDSHWFPSSFDCFPAISDSHGFPSSFDCFSANLRFRLISIQFWLFFCHFRF